MYVPILDRQKKDLKPYPPPNREGEIPQTSTIDTIPKNHDDGTYQITSPFEDLIVL